MEPISSFSSSRASAAQPPVPAQQRRDAEAITAPQPRTDTYSQSVPGQDVQLQRRQVVEDIGKNQKATDQLQSGNDQLQSARALAARASSRDVSDDERQELNSQFGKVSGGLNKLADEVEKSGNSTSAQALRVNSGIGSADEADKTTEALDASLGQIGNDLAALNQQNQTLGSDYPRTAQKNNVEPPVRSSQEANQLANQLQQQLQNQPDNAFGAQANINRQTTLTLFQ